jgi:hypothetical protein
LVLESYGFSKLNFVALSHDKKNAIVDITRETKLDAVAIPGLCSTMLLETVKLHIDTCYCCTVDLSTDKPSDYESFDCQEIFLALVTLLYMLTSS